MYSCEGSDAPVPTLGPLAQAPFPRPPSLIKVENQVELHTYGQAPRRFDVTSTPPGCAHTAVVPTRFSNRPSGGLPPSTSTPRVARLHHRAGCPGRAPAPAPAAPTRRATAWALNSSAYSPSLYLRPPSCRAAGRSGNRTARPVGAGSMRGLGPRANLGTSASRRLDICDTPR